MIILRGFSAFRQVFGCRGNFISPRRWGCVFDLNSSTTLTTRTSAVPTTVFGRSTRTLANSLRSRGPNGGFSPLYQIGGARSIQLASPQLGNRFFMSDCVPEWAEPSTRVKHHRLFTTNIARENPDAKTCERQGSFLEGVSLMLTWGFVQLKGVVAGDGHRSRPGPLSKKKFLVGSYERLRGGIKTISHLRFCLMSTLVGSLSCFHFVASWSPRTSVRVSRQLRNRVPKNEERFFINNPHQSPASTVLSLTCSFLLNNMASRHAVTIRPSACLIAGREALTSEP